MSKPALARHRGETECVPGLHGDKLRAEFDDLFGLDFVEQDAVDDGKRPKHGKINIWRQALQDAFFTIINEL